MPKRPATCAEGSEPDLRLQSSIVNVPGVRAMLVPGGESDEHRGESAHVRRGWGPMSRRHRQTTPRARRAACIAALAAVGLLLFGGAGNAPRDAVRGPVAADAESETGTVTITSGPSDPTTATDATFEWIVVRARWAK